MGLKICIELIQILVEGAHEFRHQGNIVRVDHQGSGIRLDSISSTVGFNFGVGFIERHDDDDDDV
jgi:hypothetical protein